MYEELALAAEGMQRFGSSYATAIHSEADPQCPKCDTAIPVAQYIGHVGATTTIPCPGCGTGCPTYPAPPWLKAELPTALQVFGGDPKTANNQAGLQMDLAVESPQPVVMSCPSCNGGLTIGADNERTTPCPYCQASVFLPDELWKRLHPAQTMTRWTLTYTGKLKTAKDIAEEAERKQERQWDRAARAPKIEKKESSARTWFFVLAFIAAVGVSLYVSFSSLLFSNDDSLRKNGVTALAKILSVSQTNSRHNDRWVYKLALEVHAKGSKPYRVNISEPFDPLHVMNLRRGAWLEVKYDPKDRHDLLVTATGSNPPTPSSDKKPSGGTWTNFPCSCVSEGEEDRRVQLAIMIDGKEKGAGPFDATYRLHVGDQQHDLKVSELTAPQSTFPNRSLEFAIHCSDDRVVVGTQHNLSAWSLDDGTPLWSTKIKRKVNLLARHAPNKGFSVVCREVNLKRGKLQIPVGKRKRVVVDIANGHVRTKK